MPFNTQELMDAVAILADEHEMKATVTNSGKGAMICAGACFVGGILLGPIGLAIGGTAGGVTAAMMSKGKKNVKNYCSNGLKLIASFNTNRQIQGCQ